ncbi:MAG: hypothetical protein K2P44_14345, partial [Lachnospiraceae bacterium]|nr:hypothetical protein [Lachnospiraceae bacterium]
ARSGYIIKTRRQRLQTCLMRMGFVVFNLNQGDQAVYVEITKNAANDESPTSCSVTTTSMMYGGDEK